MERGLARAAIKRGWRKRCPHCGQGPLFAGWRHIPRCSVCGLVFERNAGDTWAFTIIFDRLPLGLMVALVYFGLFRAHRALGIGAFLALGAAFIATSPNRWGFGIALHYLSRVIWPDPADPLPPRPTIRLEEILTPFDNRRES